MRSSLAFAFVMLAAAAGCGTDPAIGGNNNGPDGGNNTGPDGSVLMPPSRGFQMISPDIAIQPGEEATYCWYFKTPNTELYSIKRWVSQMTPGSHHMILFFTGSAQQPEGTVKKDCGFFSGGTPSPSSIGTWVYSAQNPDQDMPLPADDGAGKPVGMDVPVGQYGFIQMHYLNTTDAVINAHVTLNAEAYDAGVQTTKTFAYVTYNGNINIPMMSTGTKATMTCNIPSTSKVWLMSTHAHKQAIHTEVRDGTSTSTTVVFSSDNWEHPGAKTWMTSPFYTFTTGKLTNECIYDNPNSYDIHAGDSAKTDEMCMASGYIFPATKSTICYNSIVF